MAAATFAPAAGALRDSTIMLRRSLVRMRRYPSMTVMLIGQPVLFLVLFVYVFGGGLAHSLPGAAPTRHAYLTFVVPAVLVMAVASVALGTAISIAMDMTSGIISRFRTMPIARSSVLAGHVAGALVQTVITLVIVGAVALGLGYRPRGSVVDWTAAAGLLLLFGVALTWLTIALGLVSKSVETASNLPMFLTLLPFVGNGFTPADTMPPALAWFARNQPFTPMMDSVRGLAAGHPSGHAVLLAVVWSVAIAAAGFAWSQRLYARRGPA